MRFRFALFWCCLAVAPLAANAETRFLTHSLDTAVHTDEKGYLRGNPHAGRRAFYVEVVHAMMLARGMPSLIEEVSLSRGFHLLDGEADYAFFNVIRNDDRRNRYKWVGPIDVFPTYFYELKASPTAIHSIDDARHVGAVCALSGNNLVGLLEQQGFQNILKANSNDACAKLLRYGRVNLITGSEYPWFMTNPELKDLLVRTTVTLSVDEGFIAFSRSTPEDEIIDWQAALDSVRQTGLYDRLRLMHLQPHRD